MGGLGGRPNQTLSNYRLGIRGLVGVFEGKRLRMVLLVLGGAAGLADFVAVGAHRG
jgi:hypothetical protein